jgi:hypothetical protein
MVTTTTTDISPDLGELAEILDDINVKIYPNTLSLRK